MRFRFFAVLVLLLCMPFAAVAKQSAQDLVQSVADQTIAKIKSEKAVIDKNPERLYELINEYLLPHFDFQRMSKWVLGRYWLKANNDQRKRFVAEFRTLLVRTYATSLKDYSDQEIKYLPFEGSDSAKEVTVRSEVAQPGGFPIPISYRLHKVKGEWKVFDINIDDISLVSNYRTTFAREIRKTSMEDLIQSLAKRNQDAR